MGEFRSSNNRNNQAGLHEPTRQSIEQRGVDAVLPSISIHELNAPDRNHAAEQKLFEQFRENHFLILDDVFAGSEIEKLHHMQLVLFGSTNEEKQRYAATESLQPGFSPYGNARALDTGIPNLLETWDFPRVDPPMNWPPELNSELDFLRELEDRMYRLALVALSALAKGIGDSPDAFMPYVHRRSAGMQLIHYFPLENIEDVQGARRQSHHADNTLITIIPPPTASGLKAQLGNGEWVYVQLEKTQCLIQAGRMLQRITGDAIQACLHTVDVLSQYQGESRYSTPFFVSVPEDAIVSVLPNQQTPEIMNRYPSELAAEIQREYFQRIFAERYKK